MIETKVEGSTSSVDAVETWLRRSLGPGVEEAADDVIAAKQLAERHWEGRSGTAYVGYARDIIEITDEHAERVRRAAGRIGSYSARLQTIQDRMRDLRNEARDGGLTVAGTTIAEPATAAADDAQVDRIELYNRILGDVEEEWTRFVDWVDTNLRPVTESLEAPLVEKLVGYLEDNAGNLGISFALTHGERTLKGRQAQLHEEARKLRQWRRSGHPGRRAIATAPDAPARIRDLTSKADWFGKGGRLLGPLGTVIELWSALESDAPAGGVVAAGVGIGVTALVIATAPVSVPTVVVVAGAVVVGAGASYLATEGWEALPDAWTDPADEFVGETWDDTVDTVSDGWNTVKGWF